MAIVVAADNSTAVTLAIGTNPSAGTLSCTNVGGKTVTAASGVASFTCSIDKVGTGYTLGATSSPVLTPATTNAFNITPGAASKLAVTTQPPASSTSGASFAVGSRWRTPVATWSPPTTTTSVTLAIGTNPSAGTLTCTNVGGKTVHRRQRSGQLHLLDRQGRDRLHAGGNQQPGTHRCDH